MPRSRGSPLAVRHICLYICGVIALTLCAACRWPASAAIPRSAELAPAGPECEKRPDPPPAPQMGPAVPRWSTRREASAFGPGHRRRKRGSRPNCCGTSRGGTADRTKDDRGALHERLAAHRCEPVQLTALAKGWPEWLVPPLLRFAVDHKPVRMKGKNLHSPRCLA